LIFSSSWKEVVVSGSSLAEVRGRVSSRRKMRGLGRGGEGKGRAGLRCTANTISPGGFCLCGRERLVDVGGWPRRDSLSVLDEDESEDHCWVAELFSGSWLVPVGAW